MYKYKAVPGPKEIVVDKEGGTTKATQMFADIINAQAIDGWHYHSMETVTVTTSYKTGCFLNRQVVTTHTNIYMLIFEMEQ